MNSTSFGEAGGSVPVVFDGSVRVGCPGAPGWTITGAVVSACCAKSAAGKNKRTAALKIIRPPARTTLRLLGSNGTTLGQNEFIQHGLTLTLSHSRFRLKLK